MKERVGKRGVSPVVASVLLILLVIVLGAIIFLWARGFIGEQISKFGKPIEETCNELDFDVSRAGVSDLEIRNNGNMDISHFDIRMSKDGDSEVKQYAIEAVAGGSVRESVTLKLPGNVEPDEVVIYPALIGENNGANKFFSCLDSGVII